MAAFTQDRRYLEGVPYLEHVKKEGGVVTMCAVADALITEGIQKGKLEGKVELLYEMDYSVEEIAEKLNISEEKVQELLQK